MLYKLYDTQATTINFNSFLSNLKIHKPHEDPRIDDVISIRWIHFFEEVNQDHKSHQTINYM